MGRTVYSLSVSQRVLTTDDFASDPRYFGGLLSAYAYTKDPQLLNKAKELGDTLLLALNTTSGYPKFSVRPSDGALGSYWGANRVILAEMGTIQLV